MTLDRVKHIIDLWESGDLNQVLGLVLRSTESRRLINGYKAAFYLLSTSGIPFVFVEEFDNILYDADRWSEAEDLFKKIRKYNIATGVDANSASKRAIEFQENTSKLLSNLNGTSIPFDKTCVERSLLNFLLLVSDMRNDGVRRETEDRFLQSVGR